jgi:ubiquinone/menaquinone biosynthesis C-methylase UbiE
MHDLLYGLKALAEDTRLRIVSLCGHAELAVRDISQILGQSQPRVSRHLKLLLDAGVLERNREGIWAFYRTASTGPGADLARVVLDLMPDDDPMIALDLQRLAQVKAERDIQAQRYFSENSARWHLVRSLYVNEDQVEQALATLLPPGSYTSLLDVGTGTGRVLELLGSSAEKAVGIDLSNHMLSIARANIDRAGLAHCQVRKADMYNMPLPAESFDALTMHMVLHYADQPQRVLQEAARVMRPGGRIVVVDFAPHQAEFLRLEHAHLWMGFSDDSIRTWFADANLDPEPPIRLEGTELTVCLWPATRERTLQ